MSNKIIIIDFGSQYTQLIARRVREMGVFCDLLPYDCDNEVILASQATGIILSGGPETVTANNAPAIPAAVFDLDCPVLGICYGMQAMAVALGGKVLATNRREFGHTEVEILAQSPLFNGLDCHEVLSVWMSHGDIVTDLPTGFIEIANSDTATAVIAHQDKPYYGLQFHPEVTHTAQGMLLLTNFVKGICACEENWTAAGIAEEQIAAIRQQVGTDHVILGLSGGVDSSVVAALLHQAIGKQLLCIFVDTGLLRHQEAERVMDTMNAHMGVTVIKIEAETRFLRALAGVSDPEAKRKVIGNLFIEIFEEEAAKHQEATWLAQGTIYSDVIESAGNKNSKGHVIKSHHNVGGLPEQMNLKLIEPLRGLFKDEVRRVGTQLGLPDELIHCHPFPGPGLGVRILGEVKKEYADILRQADHIFIEELRRHDLYEKVHQAFAVFLPIKSVAVMGDGRVYDYVIALRAVETIDFMTAHWAELPYGFLGKVSNRILNEVKGVSRVAYDISGKPPATIEWE